MDNGQFITGMKRFASPQGKQKSEEKEKNSANSTTPMSHHDDTSASNLAAILDVLNELLLKQDEVAI
jgi:hypothetical protein